MNTNKSIGVLNTLLEANNDRIQGYETAANETDEAELRMLFLKLAITSKSCNQDLKLELKSLNYEPTESHSLMNKFFRVWLDVKAALTCRDTRSILNSCGYGENTTLEIYNKVLAQDTDYITIEQHKMIYKQYVSIKSDFDKINILLEMQLEHN